MFKSRCIPFTLFPILVQVQRTQTSGRGAEGADETAWAVSATPSAQLPSPMQLITSTTPPESRGQEGPCACSPDGALAPDHGTAAGRLTPPGRMAGFGESPQRGMPSRERINGTVLPHPRPVSSYEHRRALGPAGTSRLHSLLQQIPSQAASGWPSADFPDTGADQEVHSHAGSVRGIVSPDQRLSDGHTPLWGRGANVHYPSSLSYSTPSPAQTNFRSGIELPGAASSGTAHHCSAAGGLQTSCMSKAPAVAQQNTPLRCNRDSSSGAGDAMPFQQGRHSFGALRQPQPAAGDAQRWNGASAMVTSPTEPANAAQHLLSRGSVKAGLQRQAGSQHRQLQTDNMSSSQERLRGQARTLWPSFTCVVYEKFDTVALLQRHLYTCLHGLD